ncbi:hypothetical protein [Frateuria aurantia]|uniref:Lipoprotein n=1 Tax=Frateuria aurantia (strain ATCC 33424 / DSM 6220 / KCTC 2777 / LMG 1558 / NBRC 3245 / NCIMB 13370) TaxID=767434 RepID=H8KZR0_FRAAD|nr:hypothetical protein [Frateuria aurantia]AFC84571.1 hypothetical protein Fraau_0071 [Frateuria aurantia DSM 6220]
MIGRYLRLMVLGGLPLLAACVHQIRPDHPSSVVEGRASYREQAQAGGGTARYSLALGESAIQPVAQIQVAPRYPVMLIPLHLPARDIPAQLAVDGNGHVYNVIVPGEATADPALQAFVAAIRTAVAQWRFSPLIIQHMAADADGNSHVVDQSRPPFSQFYVFHFELKNGVPVSGSVARAAVDTEAVRP